MPISGKEMLKRYLKTGWTMKRQTGSHVQLEKITDNETIPMAKELKKGMESALLKHLRRSS
jgi:predicted RNA binding protein YcfA (HicA-like mRNA interferase family)